MQIVSIEPTPSPNSMKINLDETLPQGVRKTYTLQNKSEAPASLQPLLEIPFVSGFYHTADFIALDRHPKGDWEQILIQATAILGEMDTGGKSVAKSIQGSAAASASPGGPGELAPLPSSAAGWGEVEVKVQVFRGIPMQVRANGGGHEQRAALPERFVKAAITAGMASPNLIKERRLDDYGIRYGELNEVLQDVVRELEAVFDEEKLHSLVVQAAHPVQEQSSAKDEAKSTPSLAALTAACQDEDWRKRYAALLQVRPVKDAIPLLVRALDDPQASIRRIAAVYLGELKDPAVLPHLLKALKDRSPAVRRTVGDTISDLGDPAAAESMIAALEDENKLVRWRAARFLYEVGDAAAVQALRKAQDDPEFEVRMQAQLALERIEGGDEAKGSVWRQMTHRPSSR